MTRRSNSREDILAAAEAVVSELGTGHLTLDAVAERAGISKGGLLYNYPNKESLLRGMLGRQLERVDEARQRLRTAPPLRDDPAAGLKAYVEAAFEKDEERQGVCGALLAAGADDPRLLGPVREWHERNFAELSAGCRNPAKVLMLMMAMDGLWMNELLGTSCFGPALKQRLHEEMLACATEAAR